MKRSSLRPFILVFALAAVLASCRVAGLRPRPTRRHRRRELRARRHRPDDEVEHPRRRGRPGPQRRARHDRGLRDGRQSRLFTRDRRLALPHRQPVQAGHRRGHPQAARGRPRRPRGPGLRHPRRRRAAGGHDAGSEARLRHGPRPAPAFGGLGPRRELRPHVPVPGDRRRPRRRAARGRRGHRPLHEGAAARSRSGDEIRLLEFRLLPARTDRRKGHRPAL